MKFPRQALLHFAFTFASVLISIEMSGCGSPKEPMQQETKTISGETTPKPELGPDIFKNVKKVYELYGGEGRLTPEQIDRLLNRYSPEMQTFVVATLAREKKDNYTFDELMSLLEKDCLVLEWMKKGPVSDAFSLKSTLHIVYPDAHDELIEQLTAALVASNSKAQASLPEIPAKVLIKRGAILGRVKQLNARATYKILSEQLIAKQIWISAPTLLVTDVTAADREIALFIAGLSLENQAETAMGSKPSAARTAHLRYFETLTHQEPGPENQTFDATSIEKLDWKMNEQISEKVTDERDPYFGFAFPRIAKTWGPSEPQLQIKNRSKISTDLFIAGAADQIMALCNLKADRPTSIEFLRIFLGRISIEKVAPSVSIEQKCLQFQAAFHPDAMTYNWWKLKLAFEFGGSEP